MPFLTDSMNITIIFLFLVTIVFLKKKRISLLGISVILIISLFYISFNYFGFDDNIVSKGSSTEQISELVQLLIIFSLFVACSLGVFSRHYFDKFKESNPKSERPSPWATAIVVSVLMSTATFAPLIETIFSAKEVWPKFLPFVAAFEKGFLWPAFINELDKKS